MLQNGQSLLFASAIGVTDFRKYKEWLIRKIYRLIANFDPRPVQDRIKVVERPLTIIEESYLKGRKRRRSRIVV